MHADPSSLFDFTNIELQVYLVIGLIQLDHVKKHHMLRFRRENLIMMIINISDIFSYTLIKIVWIEFSLDYGAFDMTRICFI